MVDWYVPLAVETDDDRLRETRGYRFSAASHQPRGNLLYIGANNLTSPAPPPSSSAARVSIQFIGQIREVALCSAALGDDSANFERV